LCKDAGYFYLSESKPCIKFFTHLKMSCIFDINSNNTTTARGRIALALWRIKLSTGSYTHTYPFNGPLSGTTQVSRYQKSKISLDFTEARDSEWQWHQLGRVQVCTSLQTDNHTSTLPLSFLQAGCPSCRPTNSVKALSGYQTWANLGRSKYDPQTALSYGKFRVLT